jgi:hypothetical protein
LDIASQRRFSGFRGVAYLSGAVQFCAKQVSVLRVLSKHIFKLNQEPFGLICCATDRCEPRDALALSLNNLQAFKNAPLNLDEVFPNCVRIVPLRHGQPIAVG